jgi:hypothetical protein
VLTAILIVAATALALIAGVSWPLVTHRAEDPPDDPVADARLALDEDLQRTLAAVREIDMDHRAGNLSDEDFAALDAAERARAVELMRRADGLAAGSPT